MDLIIPYRLKSKQNTNYVCRSQDKKDINSIENNLDLIIYQKMDLILNQEKIKEKEKVKKLKYSKSLIVNKNKNNNIYKNKEVINKRITLGKFLMENNYKNELNNIINKSNEDNKENYDNKKNDFENKMNYNTDKKDNGLSFFKRKEIHRKKNIETLGIDLDSYSHFKLFANKSNKIIIKRKLGKRYTLFKTILYYLESNNITLYELLNNNPFQCKPYELPNSYDFLVAVKFRNYKYVTEALQNTKSFLFSFDYFGQTAYHWAAKLADLEMLKLLLEFGLYHNQKDFKGRTPLYLAALNNHKEICNYLLMNNGNIFLKDKNGLSPADVAGNKELKYYLFDFMAQPFSNPIYKARIQSFLKEREERIKKKKKKKKLQNLKNFNKIKINTHKL